MVFSSIPAYLDPSNWQQQPNHHQTATNNASPQLPTPTHPAPPLPAAQPHVGGGGGGTGSIRPGSMAERARLANVPMPEGPLKCPRCESTNTKFCYFNNYSLSQPRHFCKACRRYWTRGGALRSVPVGGGCRRNKRSKAASSKSPAASSDRQTTSTSTSTVSSNSTGAVNILGLTSQLSPLRFMSPLGQLTDHYGSGDHISLNNYSGISTPLVGLTSSEMNFQIGANLLGGGATVGGGAGSGGVASLLSSGGGIEQWRMQQAHQQQFPFLGGLEPSPPPPPALFQFQGGAVDHHTGGFGGEPSQLRPKLSASTMLTQLASVKVEDNQELNLSRQFLGINAGNDNQWNNTSAWTDLSSFSSSSTSNPNL